MAKPSKHGAKKSQRELPLMSDPSLKELALNLLAHWKTPKPCGFIKAPSNF